MFQSFEKQNTITSADQRERERETRGGGGEEECQKVKTQEPIRAWDLVYNVIMPASIPVAFSDVPVHFRWV